jgi:hypothetical protein
MNYWDYYDPDFEWPENSLFGLTTQNKSGIEDFEALGFDRAAAIDLANSGYVIVDDAGIVIDRYYGGLLSSCDQKTRFYKDNFKEALTTGTCRLPIYTAASLGDLHTILEKINTNRRKPVFYRGQNQHYLLNRAFPNPHFDIPGVGEVSLMPSLWRKMRAKSPHSIHNFKTLTDFEWTNLIFSQFDLEEVRRRDMQIGGDFPMDYCDMEDGDDPLLKAFGTVALDMQMPDTRIHDLLTTALQHYGLLSPYLDITSDLDVALFFATHTYDQLSDQYDFTNSGNAVLYLFSSNTGDMAVHASHRILSGMTPLRPERQSCVICRSAPYSINLPADYLVGVVNLHFKLEASTASPALLFPSEDEDYFLAALKKKLRHPQYVASFRDAQKQP